MPQKKKKQAQFPKLYIHKLISHTDRPLRPRSLGPLQLRPLQRVVDALRLALRAVDRMVGWIQMPSVGLAGLDRRTLEHRPAVDQLGGLYRQHHGYQRRHNHC